MAIDQHGDEVLHSIYGRKFGIDKNGYAVGLPGVRVPFENSTAASTLTAYGVSALGGTTATFTLTGPPAVGVVKYIVHASTDSTAVMNVVRSSSDSGVVFYGSTGAGGVNIAFNSRGSAVTLVGLSTTVWAVTGVSRFGSSSTATIWVNITTSS